MGLLSVFSRAKQPAMRERIRSGSNATTGVSGIEAVGRVRPLRLRLPARALARKYASARLPAKFQLVGELHWRILANPGRRRGIGPPLRAKGDLWR